jgi:hypothetical protein
MNERTYIIAFSYVFLFWICGTSETVEMNFSIFILSASFWAISIQQSVGTLHLLLLQIIMNNIAYFLCLIQFEGLKEVEVIGESWEVL